MRTSIWVAVIGLVGVVAAAIIQSQSHPDRPEPLQCPSLNGRWHSDGNGITLDMVQNCSISSVFTGSTLVRHVLNGSWRQGQYHFKIDRTEDACTTTMYGTITNISANEMTSIISGTDGKCRLSANFKEQLLWTKL